MGETGVEFDVCPVSRGAEGLAWHGKAWYGMAGSGQSSSDQGCRLPGESGVGAAQSLLNMAESESRGAILVNIIFLASLLVRSDIASEQPGEVRSAL
ncbi:uncharacterized protein CTRU02_205603 [Colletotrichum truncatum]|uniref:Uncharacterized protein n=1 Tax=Colletotrichum truncatum TaxID=5467 RepID=A0ACC3Z4G7_COLTU